MSTKYSSNIISLVKGLMEEDQYKDLMGPPLKKEIIKKVESITDTFPYKFDKDDKEFIVKKVLISLRKTMRDGNVLIDNSTFNPWYKSRQGEIKDEYWNDYKKFLVEKEDWTIGPQGTVSSLDRSTETILSLCSDPKLTSRTSRRGMVVGNVQSGKTSNYIGLITKAADAGYKVIIIIAGMLEELRKQTQIRVEESFIGKDIYKNLSVGVGVFTERSPEKNPNCDTNRNSDFRKTNTQNSSNLLNTTATAPYILVVKKNVSTLDNINLWLDGMRINNDNNIVDLPMILIDDEADNASIDLRSRSKTKKKNKPSKNKESLLYPEEDPSNYDATRINAGIRKILKNFRVSTYVGYTATPFANIFISPKTNNEILRDDLFPNDFLYYLEPASDYFGPVEAFIEKRNKNFFKEIEINEITNGSGILIPHKKDYRLKVMPESLKDCIKSFVISTSIRWLRGEENNHSSMLVNASSYSDTQVSIAEVINDHVVDLGRALKASSGLEEKNAEKSLPYKSMRDFFEDEFKDADCDWQDIKEIIHKVASKIDVVHVNRLKTSKKLNYDQHPEGRVVIAVGGFSLSRGLTLYGLVTSYYLRTSKMYDTILQMGRWFGYREDYENLCRIYMTSKAKTDFRFIAGVVNDLNRQIKIMQNEEKTPRDFALFVRSHRDTKRLIATARLKMGAAQKIIIRDTFGSRFRQNFYLERDLSKIKNNKKYISEFLKNIKENHFIHRLNEEINPKLKNLYAFKNIPVENIYGLIENFHFKFINSSYDKKNLLDYIKLRSKRELSKWEVIIDSNEIGKGMPIEVGGLKINPTKRKATYEANSIQQEHIETTQRIKSSIITPKVIYLTTPEKELENYKAIAKENKTGLQNVMLKRNKTPKLIITVLKLNLIFDKEDSVIDPNIKNYLDNLPELYTISYLFPPTNIPEEPREVLVNKDINDPYSNLEYLEEDEDDGDD